MTFVDRWPRPVKRRVFMAALIGCAASMVVAQVVSERSRAQVALGPGLAIERAAQQEWSTGRRLTIAGDGHHQAWQRALAANDPIAAATHGRAGLDAYARALLCFDTVDTLHTQWARVATPGGPHRSFPGIRVHPLERARIEAAREDLEDDLLARGANPGP